MLFNPKKILVLAPHTDDGELGCGGTIAKFLGLGADIHYAAFSTCRKSLAADADPGTLEKECRTALELLGLDRQKIYFHDFEVREFPSKRQEILEVLVSLNSQLKPDLVFIPSEGDIHQDHQVIHSEARRAFKTSSQLGYELPWNTALFRTTYFSSLTGEQIDRKIKALKAYASQSHRDYMRDDFTRSLATVRGTQCGHAYAEAFEVYKLVD